METILSKKHRILLPAVLILYFIWWLFIAFGNLPETSLPIASNLSIYRAFDDVFYQRWGFFAPPPTEDDRMYYIFTDNKDSTKRYSYEIFEKLLQEKRDQYLHNDDLSNLDYILYNTVSPIEDLLRDGYEAYKIKHGCKGKSDECSYSQFVNDTRSDYNQTQFLKTLVQHADIIRNREHIGEDFNLQIIISKINIHKYAERFSDKPREEQPFFKSDIYNIKEKSWKKFIEH